MLWPHKMCVWWPLCVPRIGHTHLSKRRATLAVPPVCRLARRGVCPLQAERRRALHQPARHQTTHASDVRPPACGRPLEPRCIGHDPAQAHAAQARAQPQPDAAAPVGRCGRRAGNVTDHSRAPPQFPFGGPRMGARRGGAAARPALGGVWRVWRASLRRHPQSVHRRPGGSAAARRAQRGAAVREHSHKSLPYVHGRPWGFKDAAPRKCESKAEHATAVTNHWVSVGGRSKAAQEGQFKASSYKYTNDA